MSVPLEMAFVLLAVVAVLMFLASRRQHSKTKTKTFRCARCSATAPHTARTLNAWQEGKTKFYCGKCHAAWLKTQPAHVAQQTRHASRPSMRAVERGGCLGVLACLVIVPLALVGMWIYAS